ncbi:MAG: hypothetical protein N3A54_03920 [Patescibacteria group bacterium]|nr:hypothetical protein [Patescibacteria group bacterium]
MSDSATAKGVNNRISQQVVLFQNLNIIFNNYNSSVSKRSFVEDVLDRGERTIEDIKSQMALEAGVVFSTKKDIEKFVNSLDTFLLSFLVPYVDFIKPFGGSELRLHLFDLNRLAMRRFISGERSGMGSIGEGRETPGGVGIQKMDIEYLVNQESGYLFSLFKISTDIFFNSMEDVIMTIGSERGRIYTPIDVLIATTQDIHSYLLKNGTNQIVSNLYRTYLDVGYMFDESFEGEPVRSKWAQEISERSGISFESFMSLIKRMRYSIEAYLYKWVWDVQENGNIVLHLEYYGSDRAAGATSFANILTYNETLNKYNDLASKLNQVEGETLADKTRETNKVKEEMSKLREGALVDAISGFFMTNLAGGKSRMLVVPKECLDFDYTSKGSIFDRLALYKYLYQSDGRVENLKSFYNNPTRMYDFRKMLKNESSADSQTVVENSFVRYDSEGAKVMTQIPFFYLSDMIEYFVGVAFVNLTKKDSSGTVFLPPGSVLKVYLGYVNLVVLEKDGYKKKLVPLGSLPISWDLFMRWWVNRVKRNTNLVYKLEEFFADFFGYFFGAALGQADDFGLKTLEVGSYTTMYPHDLADEKTPRVIKYYLHILNRLDRTPITFYIGNRKGLLKTCKFSAEQNDYLSSYFMSSTVEGQAPENNLQNQRAIYNLDITLFGNSLVVPGMLLEVVPTIVGASYDSSERFKNLYDMGVGGLYNAVSCRLSLQQGEFTSTIHAKYFGKPFSQNLDSASNEAYKNSIFGYSYEKSLDEQKSHMDDMFVGWNDIQQDVMVTQSTKTDITSGGGCGVCSQEEYLFSL